MGHQRRFKLSALVTMKLVRRGKMQELFVNQLGSDCDGFLVRNPICLDPSCEVV